MRQPETNAQRRARRVRAKLQRINKTETPRLSVHRTNNQIYVQIIDDVKGITLAAASTLEGDLRKTGGNVAAATKVGALIAERAKSAKVSKVMFDRGSFRYHGRVKALAEAARAGGLEF
ncbi:MAG: 50S ribosomal protein L18 [Alphaproteobacteria bacterium]|jgi:large subunit ribosomal protein L18|nr:50S ribosomal protein L18 [Alphaproteobacteria bacterium]MCB1550738.1 50S ribosomal protein L18 [Alphaproteobacteria bacterium]MCB9985645.1 50S ribosomal protein L18 [Micavibrio sp.]HRK98316.1 50S ribosomal protein L18 [Alphaproteobacteria bacterium]